ALASTPGRTEVVVKLEAPSLARAVTTSRALTPEAKARRLDLTSSSSRGYLAERARARTAVERRILTAIPSARVRWRYAVVLNGLSVVLAPRAVQRLATIQGAREGGGGGRFR